MSRLCCIGCEGFSLSISGTAHVITDLSGRVWRFEQHHYYGPIVLRNDGEPKARQPGSRSPFWPAYEAWRTSQTNQVAHVDSRQNLESQLCNSNHTNNE